MITIYCKIKQILYYILYYYTVSIYVLKSSVSLISLVATSATTRV